MAHFKIARPGRPASNAPPRRAMMDMLPENWTTLSERTWYYGAAKEVGK